VTPIILTAAGFATYSVKIALIRSWIGRLERCRYSGRE